MAGEPVHGRRGARDPAPDVRALLHEGPVRRRHGSVHRALRSDDEPRAGDLRGRLDVEVEGQHRGADAARRAMGRRLDALTMLFANPFEDDIDWKPIAGDADHRPGVHHWLGRVFAAVEAVERAATSRRRWCGSRTARRRGDGRSGAVPVQRGDLEAHGPDERDADRARRAGEGTGSRRSACADARAVRAVRRRGAWARCSVMTTLCTSVAGPRSTRRSPPRTPSRSSCRWTGRSATRSRYSADTDEARGAGAGPRSEKARRAIADRGREGDRPRTEARTRHPLSGRSLGPVKEPSGLGSCPLDVQDEAVEAGVEGDRSEPESVERLERVYREQGVRIWRAVLLSSGSRRSPMTRSPRRSRRPCGMVMGCASRPPGCGAWRSVSQRAN